MKAQLVLGMIATLFIFIGCSSSPSGNSASHKRNKDNSGCFRECEERYSAKPERLQSCKKICRQFSENR